MNLAVGSKVAVRRVWRTTTQGKAVGGTATYCLGTSDGSGGLQYWTGSAWQSIPFDFALPQDAALDWIATYTIPLEFAGLEIHEIAKHSIHGERSKTYKVDVVDVASLLAAPSRKHHP